jgi:hypothetical protein
VFTRLEPDRFSHAHTELFEVFQVGRSITARIGEWIQNYERQMSLKYGSTGMWYTLLGIRMEVDQSQDLISISSIIRDPFSEYTSFLCLEWITSREHWEMG